MSTEYTCSHILTTIDSNKPVIIQIYAIREKNHYEKRHHESKISPWNA